MWRMDGWMDGTGSLNGLIIRAPNGAKNQVCLIRMVQCNIKYAASSQTLISNLLIEENEKVRKQNNYFFSGNIFMNCYMII